MKLRILWHYTFNIILSEDNEERLDKIRVWPLAKFARYDRGHITRGSSNCFYDPTLPEDTDERLDRVRSDMRLSSLKTVVWWWRPGLVTTSSSSSSSSSSSCCDLRLASGTDLRPESDWGEMDGGLWLRGSWKNDGTIGKNIKILNVALHRYFFQQCIYVQVHFLMLYWVYNIITIYLEYSVK